MANRGDILAGEAYVALDLDDAEYRAAMTAAMKQLKRFENQGTVFSRSMRAIDRTLSSVATKVRIFGRAVQSAIGTVSKFSRLVFDTLAPSMFFLGASAAAMGASILAAVRPAAKAFASLEDVVSRFRIVFGEQARETEAWARSFAKSIGYADSTILDVMGRFQALLTTQGVPAGLAGTASRGLAELVPNLSSFFEMRPDDVITRLFSGLVGEMEAVRRLGVDLSAQSVNRQLESVGIDPQEATQAQKAMARYNIIVMQTAVAHSDLQKTADSLANTVVRLSEAWKRTKEVVGGALAPALTSLANIAQRVLTNFEPLFKTAQFQKIATSIVAVGGGLAALGTAAVTIAPLVTAFGSLASFATALAGVVTGGLVAGMVALVTTAKALTAALGPAVRLIAPLIKAGNIDLGKLLSAGSRAAGQAFGAGQNALRLAQGRLTSAEIAERGLFAPRGVGQSSQIAKYLNGARFNVSRGGQAASGGSGFISPFSRLKGPIPQPPAQPSRIVPGPYGVGAQLSATGGSSREVAQLAKNEATLLKTRAEANAAAGRAIATTDALKTAFDGTSRSAAASAKSTSQLSRLQSLRAFTSGAFPKLGPAISRVSTAVVTGLRSVARGIIIFEASLKVVGLAVKPLTSSISSAFGGVVDAGKRVIGTFVGVGSALLSVGRSLGAGLGALIDSLISGDVNKAINIAVSGFNVIRITAGIVFDQLGSAFNKLFQAVASGINELITAAIYFATIITNPAKFLESLREQATRTGVQTDARLEQFLADRAGVDVSDVRVVGNTFEVTQGGRTVRGGQTESVFGIGGNGFVSNVGATDADRSLASAFASERTRLQSEIGGRVAREVAAEIAAGSGLQVDINGESIVNIGEEVSRAVKDNPELQNALSQLSNAINAPTQRQQGADIPGANPQQVDLSLLRDNIAQLSDGIKNAAMEAKNIAETASIADSSARTRFGSGKAMLDIAREQLFVLRRIEKKEGGRLEGVGL